MGSFSGTFKTRWFWYSILTIIGWAGWALFLKLGSDEIPAEPSLFLQTVGMIPVALALVVNKSVRSAAHKKGIVYSILNGIVTGAGILCLLAAYRNGGNTSVVSVTTALYPLVTFVLAVVLLREKLTKKQIAGMALATVSIVIFSIEDAKRMHIELWLVYTIVALVCFGFGGLLQKLSTDHVSAEAALVWLVVGFMFLEPLVYSGRAVLQYSTKSVVFILLAGILNALGSWAVLAAMKNGGKASIVVPLTAVYPMVVCVLSPILLHEHITAMQGVGIACGMGAIYLLAS